MYTRNWAHYSTYNWFKDIDTWFYVYIIPLLKHRKRYILSHSVTSVWNALLIDTYNFVATLNLGMYNGKVGWCVVCLAQGFHNTWKIKEMVIEQEVYVNEIVLVGFSVVIVWLCNWYVFFFFIYLVTSLTVRFSYFRLTSVLDINYCLAERMCCFANIGICQNGNCIDIIYFGTTSKVWNFFGLKIY